jgi:hypothetical protein
VHLQSARRLPISAHCTWAAKQKFRSCLLSAITDDRSFAVDCDHDRVIG